MNNIEKEILHRVQQGDIKAFDFLFNSYYAMLCVYAKDLLKIPQIAEEIVQDVFLKFWNNRSALSVKTSVKGYLYKMVHNHCLNYIRDHSTQKTIKEYSIEDIKSRLDLLETDTSNSVLDDLLSDQIEDDLNEAIDSLPEQSRKIFCMCRFQGLSYSEAANQLNISVSTVKTLMLRSMEKLKEKLEKHFPA
jgi:RNA polymerase sigma-70 factor, ECF subfamily